MKKEVMKYLVGKDLEEICSHYIAMLYEIDIRLKPNVEFDNKGIQGYVNNGCIPCEGIYKSCKKHTPLNKYLK